MEQANEDIVIRLTREEAVELFMRCLRSHDDDTETSVSVLRQLAAMLKFDSALAEAGPSLRIAA